MKLYCSILLILVLLLHNSVQAQELNKTYRVQESVYVKEVDTNMVQSENLKFLDKKYRAKVITIYKDTIYLLCFFKNKYTRTEFGLNNRKEKSILLVSSDFNFSKGRFQRANDLYSLNPNIVNVYKKGIAEINKNRIDEYLNHRINFDLILDSASTYNEPDLIRVAAVHKNDFDRIFNNHKNEVGFARGALVVPFKFRPQETQFMVDPQLSIGFYLGANYLLRNSEKRFTLSTGFLASRVKIDPKSISGTGPIPTSIYYDPRFYNSYTIPIMVGYEYKNWNMGLIMGWEQILATTPIPVPFDSRFWMGISFGYKIF
jgi:hypothetical protein